MMSPLPLHVICKMHSPSRSKMACKPPPHLCLTIKNRYSVMKKNTISQIRMVAQMRARSCIDDDMSRASSQYTKSCGAGDRDVQGPLAF